MRRWAWTLLLLLLLGGSARADGAFFAPPAYPRPPAIPTQRALVVHEDGVEKLTVESALSAEGQSFGWILPVPAEPTSVEATTQGALDTLEIVTRPRIRHGPAGRAGQILPLLVWLVLFLAISRFLLLRKGFALRGLGYVALVALGFLLLPFLAIPNLLATRLPTVPVSGVSVSEARRVGSYSVTVLRAEDAGALSAWLAANGLAPVPAVGAPIVEAYIEQGWRFVAAKLVADGAGLLVPHPLHVEFPAVAPVYPMRLTALAGSEVALRLWVLADGRASVPTLETTYCARLEGPGGARSPAHPDLVADARRGAVLSRLEGTVPPAGMARDLPITLGPFEAHLPVRYTSEGADGTAVALGAVVWLLGMLVLLFVPPHRFPPMIRHGRPFLLAGALFTVLVTLGALVFRQRLPTIETTAPASEGRSAYESVGLVAYRVRAEWGDLGGLSPEEVRGRIDESFRSWGSTNPYFGRPVRWGDSPGDFLLLEDDRGLVLRRFDARGAAEDEVLRAARSG